MLTVVIEGQHPDPVEMAHYRFEKVRGGVKLLDVPQTVTTVFKDIKDCIKQLKTPKVQCSARPREPASPWMVCVTAPRPLC